MLELMRLDNVMSISRYTPPTGMAGNALHCTRALYAGLINRSATTFAVFTAPGWRGQ